VIDLTILRYPLYVVALGFGKGGASISSILPRLKDYPDKRATPFAWLFNSQWIVFALIGNGIQQGLIP